MVLNNRLFVIRRMLQTTRQFHSSVFRADYEGPGKTTVDFITESEGKLLITKCLPVGFKLSNNALMIGPLALYSNTALSWNVKAGTDINEENLSLFTILNPPLDFLLIGLEKNYSYNHILEIKKILAKYNIRNEILHVKHACGTYNFLINDGRNIAAVMIPPLIEKHKADKVSMNDKLSIEPKYCK